MGKLLLVMAVVVVIVAVAGVGGGGQGGSSTVTAGTGGVALVAPATLPPMQAQRKSFSLSDIAVLAGLVDEGVNLYASDCVPYQEAGATVAGQYTSCRIDVHTGGQFARAYRVYVAGGKLMMVGQ